MAKADKNDPKAWVRELVVAATFVFTDFVDLQVPLDFNHALLWDAIIDLASKMRELKKFLGRKSFYDFFKETQWFAEAYNGQPIDKVFDQFIETADKLEHEQPLTDEEQFDLLLTVMTIAQAGIEAKRIEVLKQAIA